jgi:hypothetical protein
VAASVVVDVDAGCSVGASGGDDEVAGFVASESTDEVDGCGKEPVELVGGALELSVNERFDLRAGESDRRRHCHR